MKEDLMPTTVCKFIPLTMIINQLYLVFKKVMDAATVRKVMDSNLASSSTGNSTGDGAVEEV